MTYKERFENLRPKEISYNETGLSIRGQHIPSENPRMSFIRALMEFENEENNSFETMPNGTRIQVDTILGDDLKYGCNCTIGGSGFGYEPDEQKRLIRMPHLSNVIIGDHVKIHNGVNIDRGVINPTVIGEGTVIDSLVHVAHNAQIGRHCALVSGCVIGGSVVIGDHTFIGMNASIKNGIKIGANVTIGAGAVVLKDVPDGETWVGNPARKLEKSKFQQRLSEVIITEDDKAFIDKK